jgi:hypothetical protein
MAGKANNTEKCAAHNNDKALANEAFSSLQRKVPGRGGAVCAHVIAHLFAALNHMLNSIT